MIRKLIIAVITLLLVVRASYAFYVVTASVGPTRSSGGSWGLQCKNYTNTNNGNVSVPVGVGCFQQQIVACPTETNGFIDPADHSGDANSCANCTADPTGVSDSDSAINAAMVAAAAASKDILFNTPGTYLVNLSHAPLTYVTAHGIIPPANMKIEGPGPAGPNGRSSGGVTLHQTAFPGSDSGILWLDQGGNTVCGLDFQGGQTGSPPYGYPAGASPGNNTLDIAGGSNYTIEGNAFEKTTGDASILTISRDFGEVGPTNVTIQYNTCGSQPYYCIVANGFTTTMTVNNNLSTDGRIGEEWDACATAGVSNSIGTGISFINNMIQTSVGDCNQVPIGQQGGGCNGVAFEGQNVPSACNLAGVTIGGSNANANYCVGTASIPNFYSNHTGTGTAAVISNNIVGTNCSCSPNAGVC